MKTIKIGNIYYALIFEFATTENLFTGDVPFNETAAKLKLRDSDWDNWEKYGFPRNTEGEFSLFAGRVSEELLKDNSCLFHAVAFNYEDLAWLICGPSGVGKSTQIHNLQMLEPGKFSIICGDRPCLKRMDDGMVMVMPSPWNGKEDWHGGKEAPLMGIICLTRGEENQFSKLSVKNAILPVYNAVIHNGTSEEVIHRAVQFEEYLLKNYPVYQLVSKDVPDSTSLMLSKLFSGSSTDEI